MWSRIRPRCATLLGKSIAVAFSNSRSPREYEFATDTFPIREQTGIGRDVAAMEFQLQAAVEIDPKASLFRFTHRVGHDRAPSIAAMY